MTNKYRLFIIYITIGRGGVCHLLLPTFYGPESVRSSCSAESHTYCGNISSHLQGRGVSEEINQQKEAASFITLHRVHEKSKQ
jgi:hypothetical protein